MRRPQKLKCQLGIAKHSHALTAIKWATERLGIEVVASTTMTSEAIVQAWTVGNREGTPPHIMILDCRPNKQMDAEAIAK